MATSLSIPAQIDRLVHYKHCTLPDVQWSIVSYPEDYPPGFFCDKGVSAYGKSVLSKRPAGSALLSHLKKGDHVLVWSIDRMFRNVGDFGTTIDKFKRLGINAHFISEGIDLSTASGQLRAAIIAVMSEHFSRMISFRTREANAIKAIRLGRQPKHKSSLPKRLGYKELPKQWNGEEVATKIVTGYEPKKKVIVKDDIKRVWGYIRVSSTGQVESGLGLESQRKSVDSACQDMGCEYVALLEDEAISSFKVSFFNRPSGKRILEEAQRGDCVVVYRFDRIFRSLSDMLATIAIFREKGITLKLIEEGIQTNSKDSDWYLGLLGTFAELESKIKGQRISEAKQFRKREGIVYQAKLTFFRIVTIDGQRRYVLNVRRAVRIRMAHILTKEVGMTVDEACHIVNGFYAQKRIAQGVAFAKYINFKFTQTRDMPMIMTPKKCSGTYSLWDEFVDAIGVAAARSIDHKARKELAADISQDFLIFLKRSGVSVNRFRERFLTSSVRKPISSSTDNLGDGGVLLTGAEDL